MFKMKHRLGMNKVEVEDKNKDNKAFNAIPWREYSNINL